MKIEIKEKGTNNYYDEYLFFANNYKKIQDNPNTKIKKMTTSAITYLIISLLLFVAFLIWYLISKEALQLFIMIFFAVLSVCSILLILLIKNNIKKMANNHSKAVFEITSDYVSAKNDNTNIKLKLDEIKSVIISKNMILFIPKEISKPFVATRIEYKEEVIKTLKKYKKDNLIIE